MVCVCVCLELLLGAVCAGNELVHFVVTVRLEDDAASKLLVVELLTAQLAGLAQRKLVQAAGADQLLGGALNAVAISDEREEVDDAARVAVYVVVDACDGVVVHGVCVG